MTCIDTSPVAAHGAMATEGATPATAIPAAPTSSVTTVTLDDPGALDSARVGAKAASLARAAQAGLSVVPGFVITTGTDPKHARDDIEAAWRALGGETRTLVVRSSSTIEDGGTSSMAGVFTSVLDVTGWPAFVAAVAAVLSSAKAIPDIEMAPLAVLVQPQLRPRLGGVLFGADPVTGRADRLVAAVVEGGPDQLVSGAVDGAHYVLSPAGRLLEVQQPVLGMGRRERRALAHLAAEVANLFGGAQDVEWAIEDDGTLRLLQSRPITAFGHAVAARGPIFGPGPVAETFPDALSPLEEDLWVDPLRRGLAEALSLTGAGSRRRLADSPVVVTVDGRVAADLALLGVATGPRRFLARFDPRPPARRLRAAWRVGRLRAALPGLAGELVDDIDGQLLDVAALDGLSDQALVSVLERSQQALVALHGHEVLVGLLVAPGATGASGAAVALHALAEGRADGLDDNDVVARTPAVLALVAPRVGPPPVLPALPASCLPGADHSADASVLDASDQSALLREALRMRIRWVHELMARSAWLLGQRLAAAGRLPDAHSVRLCRLVELVGLANGAEAPALADRQIEAGSTPLPTMFRLSDDGHAVPVVGAHPSAGAGRGAAGGRAVGRVHVDGTPAAGSILVVSTLDPGLATVLPHLGAIVSESGSVLSHLAILAREFGVPAVVGVADAVRRFPPGALVMVDGGTGEVTVMDEALQSDGAGDGDGEDDTPNIELRGAA